MDIQPFSSILEMLQATTSSVALVPPPHRSQLIKFNVGGRLFEVPRALVEQRPESRIGRMVSEDWRADHGGYVAFIDRDADVFAQVLNYLRHGIVVLPANVPREMFVLDLGYYGIGYDDESIKDGGKVVAELKEGIRGRDKVIAELSEEVERLKMENAYAKDEMQGISYSTDQVMAALDDDIRRLIESLSGAICA